jgi:hypothetical protein
LDTRFILGKVANESDFPAEKVHGYSDSGSDRRWWAPKSLKSSR